MTCLLLPLPVSTTCLPLPLLVANNLFVLPLLVITTHLLLPLLVVMPHSLLPLLVVATCLLLSLFNCLLSSNTTNLLLPCLFSTSPHSTQFACCFFSFAIPMVWCNSFVTSSHSPLPLVLYYFVLGATQCHFLSPTSYPPAMQTHLMQGNCECKKGKMIVDVYMFSWYYVHG